MKLISFTLLIFLSGLAYTQIYVEGNTTGKEIYVDGIAGGMPTLYVNGAIINSGGEMQNDAGEIELTGDWENYPLVGGSYISNGTERFTGGSAQVIRGTMNGIVGTTNQFYNLKIDKSAPGQLVSLQANVNVNSAGTIQFESNGIIRTDIISHGNNGSLYGYELYLINNAVASISGYATSGANNYIEGKFRRGVTGTANYYYPVGIQSTFLDGEEPFQINTTAATTSNIIGYVQPGTINLLGKVMYCDIGTNPGIVGATILDNPFSPADGILDQLTTNCQLSVEWYALGSAGTYNYTIISDPGPILEAECPFYASTWLGALRFFANDGYPNNILVMTSPPPFLTPGYETCPNNYTIAGINATIPPSVYRIHGIVDGTDALLPVELLNFTGKVTVEGNLLNWVTANEKNSSYFSVESSADAKQFSQIGVVSAAGNSISEINYQFLDKYPLAQTTYYRLKMFDLDNNFKYSNVISLTSDLNNALTISPNPSFNYITLYYNANFNGEGNINIYSADGILLKQISQQLEKGVNQILLNISSFAPGTYIAEIIDGNSAITDIFIKQ